MDFVRRWQRAARVLGVALLVLGLAPFLTTAALSAQEATPGAGTACQNVIEHDVAARTQRLLADCVTDETIAIANGWTFDGGGYTIYAVDPVGRWLQGSVLTVADGAGNVHDVVIDGAGLGKPCLIDGGATALGGLVFLNSTGEARRVTVRNMDRAFPRGEAPFVDGVSQLQSCGTGIAVIGDSAEATITASVITEVGYAGMLVEHGAASISNNVIVRADDVSVLALYGAYVRVTPGNQISYGNNGIQFEGEGTSGRIAGNTIAQMYGTGVIVMDGAHASLADNLITDITDHGVVLIGDATAASERDEITRTEQAFLADGSSLLIQKAAVAECRVGVLSQNGGSADVGDSTLRACDIGLGAADPGSRLTASGVTITGSKRAGVMLDSTAEADLREVRITQSGTGIAAMDHNVVEIMDAHIQDTTDAGIAVFGGSQVAVASSGLRKPGQFGVIVSGPGTRLISSENSITDAGQTGIQVMKGARLETSDTRIYGGETGVTVGGKGTTSQIMETFISDTGTNLLVTDGAQVDAVQLFTVGGTTGIVIRGEGTRAAVQESTINRPAEDGVRVQAGGWVSMEFSTITDAAGTAISLQRGADLPTAVELVLNESGCTPRVVTFPAGERTEITFRNAGQGPGQIQSNVGVAFDLAPGATEIIGMTSAPVDTHLRCILPGGNGAWEEVILRAVPPEQVPGPAQPVEPLVLHANEIRGARQGILVADGVSAIITENTIAGVTGEALTIAEGALVDAQHNRIASATPAPDDAD